MTELRPHHRPDAALAIFHLQEMTTRKVLVETTYHCAEHGQRVGTGFGGAPLRRPVCNKPLTESTICANGLTRRDTHEEQHSFEYTHEIPDPDDRFYGCDY